MVLAPQLTFAHLASLTAQLLDAAIAAMAEMAAIEAAAAAAAVACSLKPGWAGLVREDAEVTWGGSTSSSRVVLG